VQPAVAAPPLLGTAGAAAASALSNEDLERALRTGEDAGLLEDYFGPADYAELRELSQQAAAKRGAAGPRVLILPGITGSQLGQRRAGGSENVIGFAPLKIATGGITKIALNGDKSIVPLGAILLYYEKLKLRLRVAGFDAEFFAYDWRQSLDDLGKTLADHLRHNEQDGVALVCHSMGGLVARAAVTALGAQNDDRIARVVQLGTPNFGSFNAVQTLRDVGDTVKQLAFLDLRHDADTIVNDVIAPMPGACQLLPSPEKFTAIDLFDAGAWPKKGPRLSVQVLKKVPAVLQQLAPADDRFFLIAGINRETAVGMRFDELAQEFVFQVSLEGDGTVPLALAQLPGVKATYYVEETHGALPNHTIVARAVADILSTGATKALPDHAGNVRSRAVREVTETELARREPYQGRRGGQLSQRELREVLQEFVSTDTSDALAPPLPPAGTAGAAAAQEMLEQGFDRLVVGRRRQHRIDVRLAAGDIGEVKAHAVVVGIYSSVAPSGAAKALDNRLEGAITELTQRRMFSGNVGEVFLLPTAQRSVRAEMVAFVGLGAFDTFTSDVLRIAAENAIRTLVLGGITDVATVLIGSGSGAGTASALESLLTGFVKGLLDADKADRFRCLTVCESNPDTYEQIKREVFRLSATPLFEDLELTFFEDTLPPPAPVAPAPERAGRPARGPDPIYLLVRQESSANGRLVLRTSVLGAGSKATVVSGTRAVAASALAQKLEDLQKTSFKFERSKTFGAELASMVVSDEALAVLAANPDRHVVVVHDAESARIPWELLSVPRRAGGRPAAKGDAVLLAKEAGMSRRYVADNLSVAKWLEERRQDQRFNLLLVVNPTKDLEGADEEGERVQRILSGVPGVEIDVLAGDAASRPAVERAFRSGKYDAIHYAGHAFFDERDPASSGIFCAKDAVLSGRDLVGLGNLPVLVFFNACEAGRVRGARGGRTGRAAPEKSIRQRIQENVGLAEAFLRGGVANYVGTYWPVGDDSAFRFAEQFYKSLMRGAAIGDALLEGRRTVFASASIDWADYIHYGSPDFVVKL
jgi:pimeloyl-ACP methyl ester carboxylesterase